MTVSAEQLAVFVDQAARGHFEPVQAARAKVRPQSSPQARAAQVALEAACWLADLEGAQLPAVVVPMPSGPRQRDRDRGLASTLAIACRQLTAIAIARFDVEMLQQVAAAHRSAADRSDDERARVGASSPRLGEARGDACHWAGWGRVLESSFPAAQASALPERAQPARSPA